MRIAIIGSHDTAAVSMMKQQIMEVDKAAEIVVIDSIADAAKAEDIDFVIKPEDQVPDIFKDSIMEFKLRAPDNFDYPNPKKFKEPKIYRSKKDRRNHR